MFGDKVYKSIKNGNFHTYRWYKTNKTGKSRGNIIFDAFGREKVW